MEPTLENFEICLSFLRGNRSLALTPGLPQGRVFLKTPTYHSSVPLVASILVLELVRNNSQKWGYEKYWYALCSISPIILY